jgi:hypothetical protein
MTLSHSIQPELFSFVDVAYGDKLTLQDKFWQFHYMNPWVYDELIRLARYAKAQGRRKIGMKMLVERLRWSFEIETNSTEQWKLNNSYTSFYARHIMASCPDLEGFFETRELRAAA